MKNDITRDTFDRARNFSRVLMQQGRVQLDADWNEQVSILLNYLRTLTRDLIGPSAGPEAAWGFKLLGSDSDINALPLSADDKNRLIELRKSGQVLIAPGRYYVDGLMVENDDFASFIQQPSKLNLDKAKDGSLVMYLDVWERHVTGIEDDSILEVALNGPDTASRAKITWVVRAREMTDGEKEVANLSSPTTRINFVTWRAALEAKFNEWSEGQRIGRGLLRAGIEEQAESDDPCVCSPESVYRGVENQLYRVEIHRSGPAWDGKDEAARNKAATFKWSRVNGSVAARWVDGDGEILRIAATYDSARGFSKGQWIELSEDWHDLQDAPGTLVQLREVEAGSLTIDSTTTKGPFAREQFPNKPKVRRWDQEENENITLTDGAVAIEHDKWFALEDGVQVQFPSPAASGAYEFRSGDYWLIPARVATQDIEWPWQTNDNTAADDGKGTRRALPPRGIKHHNALLGLLAGSGNAFQFTDLRHKFTPLGIA